MSQGQENKAANWLQKEYGNYFKYGQNETKEENKAITWFQKEYGNFLKPNKKDLTPPTIYDVSIMPSVLKIGDPRSEIDAYVYDPANLEMVYADVGNRMNLMLDLDQDHKYTGYCGSNLPPGTYKVTIVAIDKAGNAARNDLGSITILDPKDLNGNGIEDSLEKQIGQDLKVIVLHEGNLTELTPFQGQKKFKILPGSAMTIPKDKLEMLARTKGVKGIFEDQKLRVLASSANCSSNSCAVDDPRKDKGPKGEGITLALIDTGADPNHETLAGKIVDFKDFVNNQTIPYDDNGHGTHCASLIAGDKGIGVAPEAKLVVVKVMDREGACYLSDALKAIDWCLENKELYGIKIVSFSVGGETPYDGNSLLDEACNKMADEGLLVCVAAGNSGPAPKSIVIPGDAEKVITVGAIDDNGTIFERSSRGPAEDGEIKPDIVTIGVDVVSAQMGSVDSYSSMSGTSMAVPQVAGAAACLLEAQTDLKPSDIKRLLLKTADDLGQPGPDNVYGYGALNLTKALENLHSPSDKLSPPNLGDVELNKHNASVGEPVLIEARASGDIKVITSHIKGPDRTLEIPMDDFDSNGIFSALWETSFWTPGDYDIEVGLQGRFGEVDSKAVPFHLDQRT